MSLREQMWLEEGASPPRRVTNGRGGGDVSGSEPGGGGVGGRGDHVRRSGYLRLWIVDSGDRVRHMPYLLAGTWQPSPP